MSGIEERFQLKYPFSSEVSVILRCLTLMSGTNRFRNISKPQRRIISKIDFQGIDSLGLYSRQGTFSVRCAGVQNCVLFFPILSIRAYSSVTWSRSQMQWSMPWFIRWNESPMRTSKIRARYDQLRVQKISLYRCCSVILSSIRPFHFISLIRVCRRRFSKLMAGR